MIGANPNPPSGAETKERNALCADCGKDTQPKNKRAVTVKDRVRGWDYYMVRPQVWEQAGTRGWDSGFLCTPCLQRRLGRKLTFDDYIGRLLKNSMMEINPKYCREHPGISEEVATAAEAMVLAPTCRTK